MNEVINELLQQRTNEHGKFEPAKNMMVKLALQAGEMIQQRKAVMGTQQNQQGMQQQRPTR